MRNMAEAALGLLRDMVERRELDFRVLNLPVVGDEEDSVGSLQHLREGTYGVQIGLFWMLASSHGDSSQTMSKEVKRVKKKTMET